MDMQNDRFDIEKPLDELGYILLEEFSKKPSTFNVMGVLRPIAGGSRETINVLLEVLQWLNQEGLVMCDIEYTTDHNHFYRITRKGLDWLKTNHLLK